MRSEFPRAIYPDTPADEYPDMAAVEASIRERTRTAPKLPPRPSRQSDSYWEGLAAARDQKRRARN